MANTLRTKIRDLADPDVLDLIISLTDLVGWEVADVSQMNVHDFFVHCESKGFLKEFGSLPKSDSPLTLSLADSSLGVRTLSSEMMLLRGGSIEPFEDHTFFRFLLSWLEICRPPEFFHAPPEVSAQTRIILQRRANGDL
jgi:hypothetical protein